MAQIICTRPARQAVAATATAKSAASVSVQNNPQGQRVATGPCAQTIQKPLSLCQSQNLRQKQSLAFAQIMLHASFGTLFYLREFLPLSCFGERDLLNLKRPDSNVSYGDFVDGCSGPEAETGKRGQPLKIILRGRNPKADNVLDLLEHGVFDALERNVLEAVQLTVFVDKENPSHVLESYTFSFNYTEAGVNELKKGLEAVSLETKVHTTEVKTFRTAKQGLEMIIRRLITLSTFLPILPNKRFLEVHLFYTENCPLQYEPHGFKPTKHGQILYPKDETWKKETQSCGIMDAGCHRVGLKVTSLKYTREDENDEEVGTRQVPDTLEYSEIVNRESEIGLENEEPSSQALALASDERSSQESIEVPESTQTRQDAITKGMLQQMIPTPDSELIPTQVESYLNSNLSKSAPSAKPCLSQIQTSKIKERIIISQTTQIAGDMDPKSGRGEVNCQCGWHEPESHMLECDFCHTRQHLTCYGFLHPNDEKIPTTHACYKCLLGSNESKVFRQIETLVLLRQALKIIIEDGYPSRVKEFSQKLHCSGNEVVQITDLLRKNGFLQPTPGSKSRGFAEKGLPRFRVPGSEEIKHRLRNEIFNPLAKISHHYTIPSTLDHQQSGVYPVAVPTTHRALSTKAGKMASSHTDLQHKRVASIQTIPNSEPIVISEDEDDNITVPHAAPRVAPSNCQRISPMANGGRTERDNAATTSPPSSPPHSQYSLASRAQDELRRGLRYGGGNGRPLVDADSQVASVDKSAKQLPYKRRKLSNAAHPIDIGDSAAEESC
ncbi:hypothetical protein MGYG_00433 [Nannizzia gypsea CBS 118893]|uniref:HORMA domain-containing protein n=1 Tax=Arthroderma gypseum (strain ATCC MYA-4604 / CBS 118893) TaxID=535722 RepID=E5QZT0_ARTGP|nr:hypothetical protein MGYG_00433 [Nannizzia gypsea CBS 118893]EFQ97393.1 hypothetical protein MGYG_00433 [Nannizzia gypsea CBS 118893]